MLPDGRYVAHVLVRIFSFSMWSVFVKSLSVGLSILAVQCVCTLGIVLLACVLE